MKIALIGKQGEKYQYRYDRYKEEAEKRGCEVIEINPTKASVGIARDGKRQLVVGGKAIEPQADAVFMVTPFGKNAKLIENAYIDNGAKSMWIPDSNARHRLFGKTGQGDRFASMQVPTPRTFVVTNASDVDAAIEYFNSEFPLILKAESGPQTCGIGVMIAESERSLKPMVEFLATQNTGVVVQEFIEESAGIDYRVVVVGDEVVGAVKRDNSGDDFRANIAQGGTASIEEVSDEIKEIAVKACKANGALFGGVDILPTKTGPVVIEVNTPCDFSFVEEVTGVNVVGLLLDYVLAR